MKKTKPRQCYLCGVKGKMTMDHLPPECLSPGTPKSGYFSIPACSTCNNKYSHEESKFRDYIATASAGRNSKSAEKAYQAMKRNFKRNPIGRAGRPHKDLVRLVNNISTKDFYSSDGQVYLFSRRVITQPDDLDARAVLIKIARGLHYFCAEEIVPDT